MKGKMLDKYVFGANAVLLVYDVTNEESFVDLEDWLRLAQESCQQQPTENGKTVYALLANKIDLEHLRVIKSDRHHKFAQVRIPI